MVRWVVVSWLGLSLPVVLLLGRVARERRPGAPRPVAPPPVRPIDSGLDAVHGLVQTTSIVDGGLATLRASWPAMDDEARQRLVGSLQEHAATIHHVLEGLLADAPHVRATLDALAAARPVPAPAPVAPEIILP